MIITTESTGEESPEMGPDDTTELQFRLTENRLPDLSSLF